MLEISHLKRREIQAPIVACLIRGFASVMGHDKAVEIATAAIQADVMMTGRTMAKRYGAKTMTVLVRVVREIWAKDDVITIRILEETDRSLSLDVTRCRYAELYDRVGIKELGFCFPVAGMNPSRRDSILV